MVVIAIATVTRTARKHIRVHEKQYCQDSRSGSKLLKELSELTFLENSDDEEAENEDYLTPVAVQGAKTLQEAADRQIDNENPDKDRFPNRVIPKEYFEDHQIVEGKMKLQN